MTTPLEKQFENRVTKSANHEAEQAPDIFDDERQARLTRRRGQNARKHQKAQQNEAEKVSLDSYNFELRNIFRKSQRILRSKRKFLSASGFSVEQLATLQAFSEPMKNGPRYDLFSAFGAGATTAFASMGATGKLLVGISMASFPVAVATGTAGLVTAVAANHIIGKKGSGNKDTEGRPYLVTTSLDLIAERWSRLVCAIGIKMAMADGEIVASEIDNIKNFLTKYFGYDQTFVLESLDTAIGNKDSFDYVEIFTSLKGTLEKFGERNSGRLIKTKFIEMCEGIALADGTVNDHEKREIDNIKALLNTSLHV